MNQASVLNMILGCRTCIITGIYPLDKKKLISMIYNTHLVTHVAAGVLAVGGVAVAIFPKVAEKSHQWHGLADEPFFTGCC